MTTALAPGESPASGDARRAHWQAAYARQPADQWSWYQACPTRSLELIAAAGVSAESPIIDVGGGASTLVDQLLTIGFTDLTVLDISAPALALAQARLGDVSARRVRWVEQDLLDWVPGRRFALWHDRAVFHFLTDEADRTRYVQLAHATIEPGGQLIMATFAHSGPERCSGLPVQRYAAAGLVKTFAAGFDLIDTHEECHITPAGRQQDFLYARFLRC